MQSTQQRLKATVILNGIRTFENLSIIFRIKFGEKMLDNLSTLSGTKIFFRLK